NLSAGGCQRTYRLHADTGGCAGDHYSAAGEVNTLRNFRGCAGTTKRSVDETHDKELSISEHKNRRWRARSQASSRLFKILADWRAVAGGSGAPHGAAPPT